MSMSGIEVDQGVAELFNEMKLRSIHKWASFKIESKKKIIVDVKADPCSTEDKDADKQCFDEMKAQIIASNEPRYLLYDFGFTNKEGRVIKKLAFIFWCSDEARIGDKMIYASSKDTVKKSFSGLSLEFQANDKGDFDYDAWSAEVEKKA